MSVKSPGHKNILSDTLTCTLCFNRVYSVCAVYTGVSPTDSPHVCHIVFKSPGSQQLNSTMSAKVSETVKIIFSVTAVREAGKNDCQDFDESILLRIALDERNLNEIFHERDIP